MKSEGQKQSLKHEKRLAALTGGQRSAGSGAFWSRKGDVRNDHYLFEHKWTSKKSFSIQSTILDKITTEAILDSREPVLAFHLDGQDYVIIQEHHFHELTDAMYNKGVGGHNEQGD